MTGFFLRPLIKNKPSWVRKWLTNITRYGLIPVHRDPPFWVSITQAARLGVDGKGIESRHLAVSGTARQTDAILDRRVCRERITRRNGSRKGRV